MGDITRRELIRRGMCAAAVIAAPLPDLAFAAAPDKTLSLFNLHTDEKLHVAFKERGRYVPQALEALNHLLRDHRNDKEYRIDPMLFEQLYVLQRMVDNMGGQFQIISGYRSPESNAKLHANSSGVAKGSLHLQGRAMDLRMPGVDLAYLHKAARHMKAGGVGYYPGSDFVHVDTGPVRYWGQKS